MDRTWSKLTTSEATVPTMARKLRGRARNVIADTPEFRTELVDRVRRAIAAGTYDTPERWDAALDRLADNWLG